MDAWTRELAYAIGLLATDGNLSKDGRHLTVTSANPDLLDVLRASLALQAPVRQVGPRGRCYRVQSSTGGSKALVSHRQRADPSGHSPSRISISRTSLVVSVAMDPSSCTWIVTTVARIRVTSISVCRLFVDWFRGTWFRLIGIRGSTSERVSGAGRPYWVLRYARRESTRLLPWLYYAPSVPCLARKRVRSEPFLRLAGAR